MLECPCCGQRVAQTLPLVDLSRNLAVVGGRLVYLSELEAAILHMLSKEWPRVLPRRELMRRLYGKAAENDDPNRLAAVLTRLRRKMAGEAWHIHAVYGVGLTLQRKQEKRHELQGRGQELPQRQA